MNMKDSYLQDQQHVKFLQAAPPKPDTFRPDLPEGFLPALDPPMPVKDYCAVNRLTNKEHQHLNDCIAGHSAPPAKFRSYVNEWLQYQHWQQRIKEKQVAYWHARWVADFVEMMQKLAGSPDSVKEGG
jgi:hypothetical protein